MLKSHYRDYATAAFRLLAREGSADRYRAKIYNAALARRGEGGTGLGSPTEAAIMRAEQAVYDTVATIADLEAAEYAVAALEARYGYAARRALYMVYMAYADRELPKGEISERIHRAELEIPASEKTLYRWLAYARRCFAEKRGLRL
jgi:hypothetical protein|nr:MAG TPA: hypothetical protein [Bacteriophage sp.]